MLKYSPLAVVAACCLAAAPMYAMAQNVYPPPADGAPRAVSPSGAMLDQLVAPVALYPDAVLAQIFAAATFPLQVVQADRWISQPGNENLTNGALAEAVAGQGWDPSVQALAPFPQVLQMMDQHLDWTQQLGQEFTANPQGVMEAVQRLRHRAQLAGTLQVSPEQSVVDEGGDVTISPANGEEIYIPNYDPDCVYGPWPYAARGPVDFGPWSGACGTAGDAVSYQDGTYLPFGFFLWGDFDWRRHAIHIDRERYALAQPGRGQDSDVWRHESAPVHAAPAATPWHGQGYGGFAHGQAPIRSFGGQASGRAADTARFSLRMSPSHAAPHAEMAAHGGAHR